MENHLLNCDIINTADWKVRFCPQYWPHNCILLLKLKLKAWRGIMDAQKYWANIKHQSQKILHTYIKWTLYSAMSACPIGFVCIVSIKFGFKSVLLYVHSARSIDTVVNCKCIFYYSVLVTTPDTKMFQHKSNKTH